jgi:hypothetical protein
MQSGLSNQQRALDRLFIPGLWLHAPLIGVVAAMLSGPVIALTVAAVLLAAAVTLVWVRAPGALERHPS